ncbi:hypothetical protein CRYUN_Cryun08bG0073500 [Craigia yunnanensis]
MKKGTSIITIQRPIYLNGNALMYHSRLHHSAQEAGFLKVQLMRIWLLNHQTWINALAVGVGEWAWCRFGVIVIIAQEFSICHQSLSTITDNQQHNSKSSNTKDNYENKAPKPRYTL